MHFPLRLASAVALLSTASLLSAASRDLGHGFADHGVAAPISNHRGTVATTDGHGHNVLLLWLMDHRGGYSLLLCDATTGKVDEYPVPFKFSDFDAPYASILSSANKFYTQQNSHFIEFDPEKRAFTFSHKTFPQMAMSMTEDDQGVIWSTSYPDGGLVCFNPKTKAFRDYGSVYKENWQQYNRSIAADDAGWIYFAVGNTASQIVIVDPKTGKATPVLPKDQRKKGVAYVYRDLDGKVYGRASQEEKDGPWYELYNGKATKLDKHDNVRPKKFVSGSQALRETTFPDGSSADADLVNRQLTVVSKSGQKKQYPFDYSSEGAIVMGVCASPDGHTAMGGTTFPMRCFTYDPKTDTLDNRPAWGQWNTAQRQGDHFFVFGYPGGFLLDYNPAQPWVTTAKGKPTNPQYLFECSPVIHRPTKILALPDQRHLVCAGTPDYGDTGGGLLFYDRQDQSHVLLKDSDLIPDQSTESMAAVADGKILAGTTTAPGTGGEKKAKEARMYLLDHGTRKIEWQEAVFPGVQEYTDLAPAPHNLVYGFADSHLFFVFDPAQRKVVHQFDTAKAFGKTPHEQGPRVFCPAPDGTTYVVFVKGIAKIEPDSHKLSWVAKSPVTIDAGGDVVGDRLYFIHESHVCSYKLK